MRTPKVSTKRVLGLAMAAALAVGATVMATSSAEATTIVALTVAPKTGPGATAGAVVTITGKGFTSASGVAVVGVVDFNAATTCPATAGGTAATAKAIVSSTQLTVTVPSLPLGTSNAPKPYVVCAYAASGGALFGAGKYTVYVVPTISNSGLSATSGSSLGGDVVGISGSGFTKTSKVTFAGIASPKVTFIDASNLTAVTPVLATSTANVVSVITEGGASTNGTGDTFDFLNAVSVTPKSVGVSASNTVISIKGSGFTGAGWDFTNAGTTSTVYFAKAAYDHTAAPSQKCNTIQVVSDTQLTCTVTAGLAAGAYTVTAVKTLATDATATAISTSATITAAAF